MALPPLPRVALAAGLVHAVQRAGAFKLMDKDKADGRHWCAPSRSPRSRSPTPSSSSHHQPPAHFRGALEARLLTLREARRR